MKNNKTCFGYFYYLRAMMDKDKIYDALNAAYSLLNDEYDSVCDDGLKEDYNAVLQQLKDVMTELER